MIKSHEAFINSVDRKLAFLYWSNYLINVAIDSRKMLGQPPVYAVEESDGSTSIQVNISSSKELQPYAVKVYENTDLISVSKYVTFISREESLDKREEILDVLASLGGSSLQNLLS